jgi:hypothetical protein
VFVQLKHQPDPEYYDADHHGPARQFVNTVRTSAANPDQYVSGAYTSDLAGSGSWSIVDPAATDDAQFNINLLLRKSGRMARDASELAGLQQEDQQITQQYEYASKRAASLLTLEGDMKAEMHQLSTKQLSIIDGLKNITANETAESEAAEAQAAASEGGAEEGGAEEGDGEVSEDPDAPGPGDEGAAEKARGREPMLAARKGKAALERHLPVHSEKWHAVQWQVARRKPLHIGITAKIRKIPTAQPAVRKAVKGGNRDESVASRVARAGQRAAKTAAKVGSLLDEAKLDVERQQAQYKQLQNENLQHALQEKHVLLLREATLRRERDARESMLRRERDERLRMKQHVKKEEAEDKGGAHLLQHARLPVRHTGPP